MSIPGDIDRDEQLAPPTWPVGPEELARWAQSYAEHASELTPDELLATYARVRETAKAAAAVEEWLLLAARESGVRLQDLAEVIAGHPLRDQRRTYVTGPSDRIKRLRRDHGDAAGRLDALTRRHAPSATTDDAAPQ